MAPISHGSSGGGVFDSHGRLVGITSASISSGQNLNLAIPSEAFAAIARAKGDELEMRPWEEVSEQLYKVNTRAIDVSELRMLIDMPLQSPEVQKLLFDLGGGSMLRMTNKFRFRSSAAPGCINR